MAMVIQSFLPHVGGAERQLAAVAPLLWERGIDPVIITRRRRGWSATDRVGAGGLDPRGPVPVLRVRVGGGEAGRSVTFTAGALAAMRRVRPAVVHAFDLRSPTTTALAARRMFGVPVVAKVLRGGVHGDLDRLRRKPLGGARLRRIIRDVEAFAVISSEIDAELEALGVPADRRVRVPNGVDVRRFHPAGAWPGPVAVYVGRLVPEKRVDLLVRAFAAVAADVPGARLLIAGEGPAAPELRRLAVDVSGVELLGPVTDVAGLLRVASVFVLPSDTEGLSNALLEAMASGLAVVATRVGGTPDVVTDGVEGLLVPPGDVGALSRALCRLLGDGTSARRMGAAARDRVAATLSLEVTADRLAALYRRLAAGS